MWQFKFVQTGRFANHFAYCVSCILLFIIIGCSPVKRQADARFWKGITHEIDTLDALKRGFTALVVEDAITGQRLFSLNGAKNFTPASNIKIFTLYSCLRTLGDSIPAFRYEIKDSILYLWPMADPTLMHPYFENNKTIERLRMLTGNRNIILSMSHRSLSHFGKGWMWDDYLDNYQAELTSMPLYGNVVKVRYDNGRWSAIPEIMLEKSRTSNDYRRVWRPWNENDFHLPHSLDTTRAYSEEIPYHGAENINVKLLESLLGRKITLADIPLSENSSVLYAVDADTVYRRMMYLSDNMLAEHLLLQCGMVLGDSISVSYTIDTLLKGVFKGMPFQMEWADGSGLSRYNQCAPENIVWVLSQLLKERTAENIIGLMPQGGRNGGTLRSMFTSADAPEVYAKSGSMQGVYNLSGYMKTRKGRILVFSIMNNHFEGPVSDARKACEKVLSRIGQKY